MKRYQLPWHDVLAWLPAWDNLDLPARQAVLAMADDNRESWPGDDDTLAAARDAGLLSADSLAFTDRAAPFVDALRQLHRAPLFEKPTDRALHAYLHETLSSDELAAFTPDERGGAALQRLYRLIGSPTWPSAFLDANDRDWECRWQGELGFDRFFDTPTVFRRTQNLVEALLEGESPVPLLRFRQLLPRCSGPIAARLLPAALRYGLVFIALRRGDLQVLIGLWPPAKRKYHERRTLSIPHRQPRETFQLPYAVEDMAIVLRAAAAAPLRVRGSDYALFARAQSNLIAELVPLPDWVAKPFQLTDERRLEAAVRRLQRLLLAELRGKQGRDLALAPRPKGRQWLRGSAEKRLRIVLDQLREDRRQANDLDQWQRRTGFHFIPPGVNLETDCHDFRLADAIQQSFQLADQPPSAPPKTGKGTGATTTTNGKYLDYHHFFTFHSKVANPLIALRDRHPMLRLRNGWLSLRNPDDDQLEDLWREVLSDFFRERLLPLGGIELGQLAGDRLAFTLTDAGRYLLGEAVDFSYGQCDGPGIIVQPNFEIVFLGPSPAVEAQIGRLAERRRGRRVGALFCITRKAVQRAAAAGLVLTDAEQLLAEHSAQPIPDNVRRELAAWFAQCRHVEVTSAVLIECPDADTAARAVAVAPKQLQPLTDTVIRLTAPSQKRTIVRKLREQGIFVR